MDDLKKCPFCGGEARIFQTATGTMDMESCRLSFSVRCVKCGATAPDAYGFIAINLYCNGNINIWHDDRADAIKAWNRRSGEQDGINNVSTC